jgi:hypothetical protein
MKNQSYTPGFFSLLIGTILIVITGYRFYLNQPEQQQRIQERLELQRQELQRQAKEEAIQSCLNRRTPLALPQDPYCSQILQPVEPVQPVQPIEPVQPVQPIEPVQPVQP